MDLILEKMKELHLHGMKQALQNLQETRTVNSLSTTEILQILLQAQEDYRLQNRNERLIKQAKFRYKASFEELVFDPNRGLEKAKISELAFCKYIPKGESILITGASGCGKSFLASALGNRACYLGYSVWYLNSSKLFILLKAARIDGSYTKVLENLAKTQLLIIDDFGLTNMDKQQQHDLMELIEDRHAKMATIVISQFPVASWFDLFTEKTIADAILDRLVHTSHRIELKGESLRKKR